MISYAIFLLPFVVSLGAFGETTFTMLDGKEVTVPLNVSSADLEEWIRKTNEAMFAHSGPVGERDSLNRQRGSDIVKGYLKSLLRDIAFQDQLVANRQKVALNNDESKAIRRAAAAYVDKNFEGLGRKETIESMMKTVAYYDEQRAQKLERLRLEQASMEQPWRQNVEEQRASRNYIQSLNEDLERSARLEAPERERLRLMKLIGVTLAECHKELYNAIPAALSGYSPPKLSPELFSAVKKRIQNDPQYAAHFQKQMRISPDVDDRKNANPDILHIGSAQGLDLFLTAGDSLPKGGRAELKGKARVNPSPAAFNVNTVPLFAKLARDYGVDLGTEQGLKFEGTPTLQSLEATQGFPELAKAVRKAVTPPTSKERRGVVFSANDCDSKVSLLSAP